MRRDISIDYNYLYPAKKDEDPTDLFSRQYRNEILTLKPIKDILYTGIVNGVSIGMSNRVNLDAIKKHNFNIHSVNYTTLNYINDKNIFKTPALHSANEKNIEDTKALVGMMNRTSGNNLITLTPKEAFFDKIKTSEELGRMQKVNKKNEQMICAVEMSLSKDENLNTPEKFFNAFNHFSNLLKTRCIKPSLLIDVDEMPNLHGVMLSELIKSKKQDIAAFRFGEKLFQSNFQMVDPFMNEFSVKTLDMIKDSEKDNKNWGNLSKYAGFILQTKKDRVDEFINNLYINNSRILG